MCSINHVDRSFHVLFFYFHNIFNLRYRSVESLWILMGVLMAYRENIIEMNWTVTRTEQFAQLCQTRVLGNSASIARGGRTVMFVLCCDVNNAPSDCMRQIKHVSVSEQHEANLHFLDILSTRDSIVCVCPSLDTFGIVLRLLCLHHK